MSPASPQLARFGVVVFPGSNCDADAYHAITTFTGASVDYLWHKDTDLKGVEAVILPGGFSYGDYLRCGAIARFSPIMQAVRDFAADGGLVMGICNGFQTLTEAGLLPGALIRNTGLKFVCRYVNLRVENAATPFTSACEEGDVLRIVVKHNEGNYTVDPETLGGDEGARPDRAALLRRRRRARRRGQPERRRRATSPASATRPATSSA